MELAAGDIVADDADQGPELDPNLDASVDNACGFMRGIAGHESSPVGIGAWPERGLERSEAASLGCLVIQSCGASQGWMVHK